MSAPECIYPPRESEEKSSGLEKTKSGFHSPEPNVINEWAESSQSPNIDQEELFRFMAEQDNKGLTAEEISDGIGGSYEPVQIRLNELFEGGKIDKQREGSEVFWFLPNPDNPYLNGFGILSDTDLPEHIRNEREKARIDWAEHEGMSR